MVQKQIDYYAVLAVEKTATSSEIKKAYRNLASEHHPDKNNNCSISEDKFKDIVKAYSVLKDDTKRAEYDRNSETQKIFNNIYEDIIVDMGNNFRSPKNIGSTIVVPITISFKKSILGGEHLVKYTRQKPCVLCSGIGQVLITKCEDCDGSGKKSHMNIMQGRPCSACNGSGKKGKVCMSCTGSGIQKESIETSVSIPKGVEENTSLKIKDMGNVGKDGAGKLKLVITILPHPRFSRVGFNLEEEVSLFFTEAVLGTTLVLETIRDNNVEVEIPAGTQYGETLRVKNEGVFNSRTGRTGSYILKMKVATPKEVSDGEKELYKKLAKSHSET